ncbi:MAG TPA: MarR family winged helix-turn-helix transcriptional regulator [Actinomycetales bacterium]|nr:MarR family winged helix-turn-helix transcriptional regulator [Actinomycetales bacterium]
MIEVSLLLHRIVYALDRAADRRLRDQFGVSHGRAVLLRVIGVKGPCSQHELAVELGHTDPAITGMVRELVSVGLVEVRPDPDNGRRRLVSLTAAGADLVARVTAFLDAAMAELVSAADVDTRTLVAELTKIDAVLGPTGDI